MKLEFLERLDKDEDGRSYALHFVIDPLSERAYGYVEGPSKGSGQFLFVATPYEGKNRWYLTLEAAKAYLEQVALEQDRQESETFTGQMAQVQLAGVAS